MVIMHPVSKRMHDDVTSYTFNLQWDDCSGCSISCWCYDGLDLLEPEANNNNSLGIGKSIARFPWDCTALVTEINYCC